MPARWGGGGGHATTMPPLAAAGMVSQQWVTYISHEMPCSRVTVQQKLWQWLRVHATWADNRYASWHTPHFGPHTDWCGDWSTYSLVIVSRKIPKCLDNVSFRDQKRVKKGSKPRFFKSVPRPFVMLKQVFFLPIWSPLGRVLAHGKLNMP